jgi:hypothetical protein
LNEWKMQSGARDGLVFPGFDLRNWRKRVYKPTFEDSKLTGRDNPTGFVVIRQPPAR